MHGGVECAQRLLVRNGVIDVVDVPEVDVVDTEPAQGFVQAAQQRSTRGIDDPVFGRADHARLGRDDELGAWHDVGNELAQDLFRLAEAVRECRVDERAARVPKATSCAAASSASVSLPHVIVPSPRCETFRPLRPTLRCFTR